MSETEFLVKATGIVHSFYVGPSFPSCPLSRMTVNSIPARIFFGLHLPTRLRRQNQAELWGVHWQKIKDGFA